MPLWVLVLPPVACSYLEWNDSTDVRLRPDKAQKGCRKLTNGQASWGEIMIMSIIVFWCVRRLGLKNCNCILHFNCLRFRWCVADIWHGQAITELNKRLPHWIRPSWPVPYTFPSCHFPLHAIICAYKCPCLIYHTCVDRRERSCLPAYREMSYSSANIPTIGLPRAIPE